MSSLAQPEVIATLLAVAVGLLLYTFLVPLNTREFHPTFAGSSNNRTLMKTLGVFGSELYTSLPQGVRPRQQSPDGRVANLLRRSGNPWNLTPEEFSFLQVVTAVLGFLLGLAFGYLLKPLVHLTPLVLAVLFGVFWYFVPFLTYRDIAKRRDIQFLEQMPDCLELISTSVGGGNTLNQAIRDAVPNMPEGPLKEEFRTILHNMDTSRTLNESLEIFAQRAPNEETRTFVLALRTANEMNTPLLEILQAQSQAYSEKYFAHIHAKAGQLVSKMNAVLTPTLLLALGIVVLAPFISSIAGIFQ